MQPMARMSIPPINAVGGSSSASISEQPVRPPAKVNGCSVTRQSELDRANWDAINTILASEAALIFGGLVARYPDRTSDHLKSLVQTGKTHNALQYLAAKALQEKLRSAFATQISGFDAVLTLPAFGEAPEGLSFTGKAEYCAPWTLLGAPALSLPVGFGKNGLPLGLQIVGAYREDYRMLRVAKWIEHALGFDPGIARI
jgi:Asp-tRNA(Asn)/Glu-tRNA(Gln) amidotransferase A subunit family amidase